MLTKFKSKLLKNEGKILIARRTEGEKPLGQFIGKINSKYAKYYNKKYNYIRHLFQDRYFSELIESNA